MLHTNKFLGSTLLVAGTSIGGGMLLIPVLSSFTGFVPSLFLLLFTWLFMFVTSLLFLHVNLSIPGEINMVTMAEETLGRGGKVVAWISYLLLLYSLLAAYISGSRALFTDVFSFIGIELNNWTSPLPLLIIFGVVIFIGTRAVDYVNRLMMIGLIITYFLLSSFLPSHVDTRLLAHFDPRAIFLGIPLVFTSFGFHIIIPNLTTYLDHNRKKLILSLLIGSLITLFVYILWLYLILGTVPLYGEGGLVSAWVQGEASTTLLLRVLRQPLIATAGRFFAFFALLTSFLGVSLSLASFLKDGLHVKKTTFGEVCTCLLTFIPPLLFVYFYERGFIMALQYAAIFVMILLAILPALMAWRVKEKSFWTSILGRSVLILVIVGAIGVIAVEVLDEIGFLKTLVKPYLPIEHVSS